MVDCDHSGQAELNLQIIEMPLQIGKASFQSGQVFQGQVFDFNATVGF